MKKIILLFCLAIVAETTLAKNGSVLPHSFPNLFNEAAIQEKPSNFCDLALTFFEKGNDYVKWVDTLIGSWSDEDQLEFFNYLDEHGPEQTITHYQFTSDEFVYYIISSWDELDNARGNLIQAMYGVVDSITWNQYEALLDSAQVCYINSLNRVDPGDCEDWYNICKKEAWDIYKEAALWCFVTASQVASFYAPLGAGFGIGCYAGARHHFLKRLKNCIKDYNNCTD